MPKAAIYVRLSREDRHKQSASDDSESIINQQLMLLDFLKKMGWDLYKVYNDEDFSGSDRERPAFNQLIRDAEAKLFDIVLCKTQSRFARDIELIEKYINTLFPIWGIRFLSVVDNADSANKGNRKSRQINSMVDQWYLEDLSENVRATLATKRKQGLWVGAFAPFGYMKDPNNKNHLIIDEEAAEVVRYVFDLYIKGLGFTSIAQRLNAEKIPNPATYKKLHNMPFQNSNKECSDIWHTYSVSRMISDQVYIGNTVQGKTENITYKSNKKRRKPIDEWCVVEGTHDAIIDKSVWDLAQESRKTRLRSDKKGKHSIFAGKLYCRNCGGSMRSFKSGGKKYFRCHTRFFAKEKCSAGACVSLNVLTDYVVSEIRALYDKYLDVDIASKNVVLKERTQDKIAVLRSKLSAIESDIEKQGKRIDAMYYDKLDGIITPEEYAKRSDECIRAKEQSSKLAQEYRDKIAKLETKQDDNERISALIEKYRKVEELDRLTINTLIEYIEIGGTKSNRLITIHWNF